MRKRIATVTAVLIPVLVGLILSPDPAAAKQVGDFVDDELVCRLLPPLTIDSINNQFGTTTESYLNQIGSYRLLTDPGVDVESLAVEILTLPEVVYCEPNYLLDAPEPVQSSQPFLDEMEIGTFPDQEAALALNIPQTHELATGANATVAVIDAGVNFTHPVLTGSAVSGFDYVDNDSVASDTSGFPVTGHGTFVAGVVKLVAPDAVTRSYRVLDTAGRGNGFTIAEALLQAVADSCKVVNLSIVMNDKHATLDDAIEFARNNNVLVVAAAGNDSSEVERFPASDSYTLAVAGLDSMNLKADFSNFNGKVDVCAPATRIYSPFTDSSYAWWDGTSFAAPFVAAQAALMFSVNPNLTWEEVVDAITGTAINIDSLNPAYEGMLGEGLIDPMAALDAIGAFICGDIDDDGAGPNIADLSHLVDYLFRGGLPPAHPDAANVDGTGEIPDVADLSYLVDYLFRGGPAPVCAL